jgi:hypothetical protein
MKINCIPRQTDRSIRFEEGGITVLKNDVLSIAISEMGSSLKKKRGHIHFDVGSFTLSYKGIPIIVDPGTSTYTRNKKERDLYRSVEYHNSIKYRTNNIRKQINIGYFGVEFNNILSNYSFDTTNLPRVHLWYNEGAERKIWIDNNTLNVEDYFSGSYTSTIHLSPVISNINTLNNEGLTSLFDDITMRLECNSFLDVQEFLYSHAYGEKCSAFKIVIFGQDNIEFRMMFSTTAK